MDILAIHGKAQSGKGTTVAKVIEIFEKEGYKAVELNFADKLKDASANIFRIPRELMDTTEGKKTYLPLFKMTVREVLQQFGTEGCRGIYKDIWVWNVQQDIIEFRKKNYDIVCVADMRFPNEYWTMKKDGAFLLKTVRPDYTIKEDSHSSETALDHITDWHSVCNVDTPKKVVKHAETLARKLILEKLKN